MNFWSKLSKKPQVFPRKSEYNPDNNWLIVRKLFNPICGDHFLIQNSSTGKILMKKMIGTDSAVTARALQKAFDFRLNLNAKNVLEMKDYEVEIKSDLCSQYFYFSVYYAYPEKDVSDLFTERNDSEEHFTHEELLQMFYDVSNGLFELRKKDEDRELGYLQMNKVFWDEETSSFNVIENFMNKKINEIYMTMVLSRSPFAVLSPEVLVRSKNTFKEINRLKVDAFNLGMIILCLGIGVKPGEFYNIKYTQINSQKLQESIAEFEKKYHENPLLCSIVKDLLVEEPGLRLDLRAVNKKYPTQDQVSVFLKTNSHVSTDHQWQRNSRATSNSMNQKNAHYKANSFQNQPRRAPQQARGSSFVNRPNHAKSNKSLRNQNTNGMITTTKKQLDPIMRTVSQQGMVNAQRSHAIGGVTSLSPQYPHQQRKRSSRKQMSVGNIQSPMFGAKKQAFRYNVQTTRPERSSQDLDKILKKGDADFFNS